MNYSEEKIDRYIKEHIEPNIINFGIIDIKWVKQHIINCLHNKYDDLTCFVIPYFGKFIGHETDIPTSATCRFRKEYVLKTVFI